MPREKPVAVRLNLRVLQQLLRGHVGNTNAIRHDVEGAPRDSVGRAGEHQLAARPTELVESPV
jgi:hypothetical protein